MSNYYQKNREEYFCWACDFSKISGEGKLANLFIKKFDNPDKKIKDAIPKFLGEVFDLNKPFSKSDLDILTELYKLLEKSIV